MYNLGVHIEQFFINHLNECARKKMTFCIYLHNFINPTAQFKSTAKIPLNIF